ncbi:MAG TPA: hypothetical protein VJH70_03205 [Candidatus Paceibacterota bacterium]
MNISIIYILNRIVWRVWMFVWHWYVDGFLQAIQWYLGILEQMDQFFALKITIHNWLQPLYRDYTLIGYFFGFIFRTARIAIACVIYSLYTTISALLYIAWSVIPVVIIYKIWYEISRT